MLANWASNGNPRCTNETEDSCWTQSVAISQPALCQTSPPNHDSWYLQAHCQEKIISYLFWDMEWSFLWGDAVSRGLMHHVLCWSIISTDVGNLVVVMFDVRVAVVILLHDVISAPPDGAKESGCIKKCQDNFRHLSSLVHHTGNLSQWKLLHQFPPLSFFAWRWLSGSFWGTICSEMLSHHATLTNKKNTIILTTTTVFPFLMVRQGPASVEVGSASSARPWQSGGALSDSVELCADMAHHWSASRRAGLDVHNSPNYVGSIACCHWWRCHLRLREWVLETLVPPKLMPFCFRNSAYLKDVCQHLYRASFGWFWLDSDNTAWFRQLRVNLSEHPVCVRS